jgi:hypothetical protein
MVRSGSARAGLSLALLAVPTLMVIAVAVGAVAPRAQDTSGLLLIIPSLLLGFFVLSIIAPLAAGGGVELYPADQLVAYPIRPRTIYTGALLMAPLNLAWLLQVLVALALLTYVSAGATANRLATTATVLVYLATVTLLGQAIAWTVVGLRRTAAGRALSWAFLGVLLLGVAAAVVTNTWAALLDDSPTVWVMIAALSAGFDQWGVWFVRTAIIAATGAAALVAGRVACRWALQRAGDGGSVRDDRSFARRPAPRTTAGLLLRRDVVGIWRAPALRRGALLIGLLPAAAVAATRADWTVLILVPSLVGAGAALMFAINAFCLDASGSIWVTSQPIPASTVFWTRTATVAVTITLPVTIAVLAGLTRAPAPPASSWVVAVVAAAFACIIRITATCLRWSVVRPHRADLRGPRDTPAPPGAMAVYALRLSLSATGIGLLMTILAVFDEPLLPFIGMVTITLFALRSLVGTATLFAEPSARSRVVQTVSGG